MISSPLLSVYEMNKDLEKNKVNLPLAEKLASYFVNDTMLANDIEQMEASSQRKGDNWVRNLKEEIHIIKLSNQHLEWRMTNFTGIFFLLLGWTSFWGAVNV